MYRVIYFLFMGFMSSLISCNSEKPNIYELEKLNHEERIKRGNQESLFIKEVFIISNPPNDNEKLKCLIKNFNDSIMISDLTGNRLLERKREFYRETKYLNENFEEKDPNKSGYFSKVDLAGYHKDKLAVSSWGKYKRFAGSYTWYLDKKTGVTTHFSYDLPHLPQVCNLWFR